MGQYRLTPDQELMALEAQDRGVPLARIARRLGVARPTIYAIRQRYVIGHAARSLQATLINPVYRYSARRKAA